MAPLVTILITTVDPPTLSHLLGLKYLILDIKHYNKEKATWISALLLSTKPNLGMITVSCLWGRGKIFAQPTIFGSDHIA